MKKHIIYFPLEPYKERYTIQLSAKEDGWLTHRWREAGIPFTYIEGTALNDTQRIRVGSVLDSNARGHWATTQIANFLKMYDDGLFDPYTSVIYFDDFFHPGIEALAYTFAQASIGIPMYAMLHAQSIDIFDFTYPMRRWMRHFEKGIAEILDGIFVTSSCLKDLCLEHGVGDRYKVFVAGLPYNSQMVEKKYIPFLTATPKKRQVVFSSRLNSEKDPLFFLMVAHAVHTIDPDVHFVYTTSSEELRSDDPSIVQMYETMGALPWFEIRKNQTKQQYYNTLLESTVQFNCAFQDFVSWTLLEALTCDCVPVYPFFRSFPEVLPKDNLYVQGNVHSAAQMILDKLDHPYFEHGKQIVSMFDKSWSRMYAVMCKDPTTPLFDDGTVSQY